MTPRNHISNSSAPRSRHRSPRDQTEVPEAVCLLRAAVVIRPEHTLATVAQQRRGTASVLERGDVVGAEAVPQYVVGVTNASLLEAHGLQPSVVPRRNRPSGRRLQLQPL